MWLNKAVCVNSDTMHKDRIKKQEKHGFANLDLQYVTNQVFQYGNEDDKAVTRAYSLTDEAYLYFKNGSCYAEDVLGVQLPAQTLAVNMTMYERVDGKYTCHHGLLPFLGYYHTIDFLEKSFHFEGGSLSFSEFKVLPKYFESKPYLANSVQQFAMWVLSSSRVLKSTNIPTSFTFNCQDAIRFCQAQVQLCYENSNPDKLLSKYDIISTSNLIDHVGLPNLVLAGVPLLKDTGLLITTTLKMRQVEVTGEEFINTCFGFKCELLPVVLGIRCISYDRIEYSNPVFMKPSPPDLSNIKPGEVSTARTFLWTKQPASQKMVFPQLPLRERGNITNALINCVTSCSFSLTRCGILSVLYASIGIGTAMAMLKCFISRLEGYINNYKFWEPFCSALKQTAVPFLHCLQAQMLLHNIHVHLTVSEVDCPLCNNKPLNEILGCFQLDIDLSMYDGSSFYFVGYVHHSDESSDASMLHMKALEGEDVHIFDCFAMTSTDEFKVALNFFAPLMFSDDKYNITLVGIQKTNFVNAVDQLKITPLKSIKIAWREYTFQLPQIFSVPALCHSNDFKVVYHIADQSKSETKIVLSKDESVSLSSRRVKTKKVSLTVVNFSCGSLEFQFSSSFPIKYDKMRDRMSVLSKSITISCQRQPYSIEEERPCFMVSPNHILSIVPMELDKEMIEWQAEIQISLKEKKSLQNTTFTQPVQAPEMDVKYFLKWLFEKVQSDFFLYKIYSSTDNCCCIILVNNLLFDYNHRTPAIDLAFHFLPDSKEIFLNDGWNQFLREWQHQPEIKRYKLSGYGSHYLREVMSYFARKTSSSLKMLEKSKYSILHRSGLDRFFTRAVVYYLSIDPDLRWASTKTVVLQCACCKATNGHLVDCTECGVLKYCNLKCQKSHFSEHQELCKYIIQGTYKPSVHIPFISIPFLP